MKQYLLSIYQPDGDIPPPAFLTKVMQDVDAFLAEAKSAGVWVFNGALHPAESATVIRASGGEMLITDGPFTEGKEHVGGFTVIRASDLDVALVWGRKLAIALGLPIEVRPFQGEFGA